MSLPVNKPFASLYHPKTLLWTSSHFYYEFFSSLWNNSHWYINCYFSHYTHKTSLTHFPSSYQATSLSFYKKKKIKELSLIPYIVCHLHVMTILLLPFQHIYVLFLFLVWLLWLGLPKLHWIEVVRLGILVLFQILVGRLSAFHCWVLCWLWICHK